MKDAQGVPSGLLKLLAIEKNLKGNHPRTSLIRNEVGVLSAGYHGENEMNYYLDMLMDEKLIALRNVRLSLMGKFFEIDLLILTPTFMLVTEVKNLTGVVLIDHRSGRMFQHINSKEKRYRDPILQVDSQAKQLEYFLKKKGVRFPPIHQLVVFVNRNVHFKGYDDQKLDDRIISAYKFPATFQEIKRDSSGVEVNWNIAYLAEMLESSIIPKDYKWLQYFELNYGDFEPGVKCAECSRKMFRDYKLKNWVCCGCGYASHWAFVESLKDFYLIFGDQITNRQARWWLGVESDSTTRRLLTKIGTEHIRRGKSSAFKMTFDFGNDFNYLRRRM
ncbi:hypothetical protein CEY16_07535 [Halalkalibacillus sediminis]|uniref:NERD domain-containing protein n=1 Tax=Halalkalibacillus sediminis TaxID=2018042 RepID=A0A2I0QTZ4_9BACI|nr:nuclease-related domain-containing protein [Halalkalibacillus sediminis]PKR77774.1 hypothetical protein CEY16_07535 [Halalkalibacillus sediminis]